MQMARATQTARESRTADTQKAVALLFGAVLAVVGVIGFVPQLVVDDKLLGLFGITPLNNLVHVGSGVFGLAAGYYAASESYNKYLGVVYLLVFVVGTVGIALGIGLVTGTGALGLNIDWADNLLHLTIAVVLLTVGYGMGTSKTIG